MKKAIAALIFALSLPMAAQVSNPNPQSRVAGRFVAYNYGLWSIGLYSIPSGTGSLTFYPLTATVQLPDGRSIMPFNTNASIIVGTETVTLTSVGAGCIKGIIPIGSCALTATFSSSHTNADPIRSGTYGLQEALNDAGASGGGAVTVDSAWTNLGGTDAMVSAATKPTHTGIEDVRTGAGGSGSGTVNSGTSGQLAYYAADGTAVSGLNVGTGLSISGGALNATGSGDVTGPASSSDLQIPVYSGATGKLLTNTGGWYISGSRLAISPSVDRGFYFPGNRLTLANSGDPIDFGTTFSSIFARFYGGGLCIGYPCNVATNVIFQAQNGATPTWQMDKYGMEHYLGSAPTVGAGSLATNSTNNGGEVTGLSAASSVTITFANGGWTTSAFCTATTNSTTIWAANTAQSNTAVTFSFSASFTGNLFYHCDGN